MAAPSAAARGADDRARDAGPRDLLRVLTAGSVDDGKSTLIGRLLYDTQTVYEDQLAAVAKDSERRGATGGALDLSLLTDGLRAEREQGITIDVAYRYFSTPRRKFILADCPGHEQYTRNMATGASTCDLAIVLVDARQGVLRQTRRHSFIASLLGIRHLVVAVNKMDLVGWAEPVFDGIRETFTEFAARLGVADVRFIPLSALAGDNVVTLSTHMPWYQGESLLHVLETVHIASDRNLADFRLPVQYVNRAHADFRGLCGTVASGIVRPGDALVALPSGQPCHVDAVLVDGQPQAEGFPPMAVTLTLREDVDISRGDLLVHPGRRPRVTQTFDATIVWMGEEALSPGRPYLLKHTTRLVTGHVSTLHHRIDVSTLAEEPAAALAMNEVGVATITVNRPLVIDAYGENRTTGAFVVIDRLTNRTVGAGMIREGVDGDETTAIAVPDPATAAGVGPEERARRLGHAAGEVLLRGASADAVAEMLLALERRLFDAGIVAVRLAAAPRSAAVARLLVGAGLVVLRSAADEPAADRGLVDAVPVDAGLVAHEMGPLVIDLEGHDVETLAARVTDWLRLEP